MKARIFCIIFLCFLVSAANAKVKTNQVSIDSNNYERYWVYKTDPKQASDALIGPISTIIPDGDLTHFFCDSGFAR